MINKGTYFRVLDKGFVGIQDWMGDDRAIEQAARVSYQTGTRPVSNTRDLIRYLVRHNHGTPLEMGEMKFHIRIPMDAHRQLVRHRTASINEYSTRYSEAIDVCQTTPSDQWRLQSTTNKQGSNGVVTDFPEGYEQELIEKQEAWWDNSFPGGAVADRPDGGKYLSEREEELQLKAREVYEERLMFGVAREQARKDLPLSTYTELYWKMDVRNLLHFLYLRCDEHAQLEIRSYANVIAAIVKEVFPLTFEAFHDYRMDTITFTRAEWKALQEAVEASERLESYIADHDLGMYLQRQGITNKREQQEFHQKLRKFDTPPKDFSISQFQTIEMSTE